MSIKFEFCKYFPTSKGGAPQAPLWSFAVDGIVHGLHCLTAIIPPEKSWVGDAGAFRGQKTTICCEKRWGLKPPLTCLGYFQDQKEYLKENNLYL